MIKIFNKYLTEKNNNTLCRDTTTESLENFYEINFSEKLKLKSKLRKVEVEDLLKFISNMKDKKQFFIMYKKSIEKRIFKMYFKKINQFYFKKEKQVKSLI